MTRFGICGATAAALVVSAWFGENNGCDATRAIRMLEVADRKNLRAAMTSISFQAFQVQDVVDHAVQTLSAMEDGEEEEQHQRKLKTTGIDVCKATGDQLMKDGELSGVVCDCTKSGIPGTVTLSCAVTLCTLCNTKGNICGLISEEYLFLAANGALVYETSNIQYTGDRTELLTFNRDSATNDCTVLVNGKKCSSCTLNPCDGATVGDIQIDCSNIEGEEDSSLSTCEGVINTDGVLQAFNDNEFNVCQNFGTLRCEATIEELEASDPGKYYCTCDDDSSRALLTCHTQCGLFCSDSGDSCGRLTDYVYFSQEDGSSVSESTFQYTTGRRVELVAANDDTCSYFDSVFGSCKCSSQDCDDGISMAPLVDCTAGGGGVVDLCQSEPQKVGNPFEYDTCVDKSPVNDVCSQSSELALDGSTTSGSLEYALYYSSSASCSSDVSPSDDIGLWYKVKGQGTGIRVSTCSEETDFDSQISVFSGKCDALECVKGNNDDSRCKSSSSGASTVLFFGEYNVMYHIRVHGYLENRGNFTVTVEEANLALPACEEKKSTFESSILEGTVCSCEETGPQEALMACHDDSLYCSTDRNVCAAQTFSMEISVLDGSAAVMLETRKYNYTKGPVDGVLELEKTGCDLSENCTGCRVLFNGNECDSCEPVQCSNVTSGFDVDCSNLDPDAVLSVCDYSSSPGTIESIGPLQVLTVDNGFDTFLRDPLATCQSVANSEEFANSNCACTESDSGGAYLACIHRDCEVICIGDLSLCWTEAHGYVFDADGQQMAELKTLAYTVGRNDVVLVESISSNESCQVSVNGESCNSCEKVVPCQWESIALNCENIETGASFSTCQSVTNQTGVLRAFNIRDGATCTTL